MKIEFGVQEYFDELKQISKQMLIFDASFAYILSFPTITNLVVFKSLSWILSFNTFNP